MANKFRFEKERPTPFDTGANAGFKAPTMAPVAPKNPFGNKTSQDARIGALQGLRKLTQGA